MANSKLDYLKEEERSTDLRFNGDSYIVVRVDGDKFHNFCSVHNFHKPNDKRALDLMVDAAKQVLMTFKGHIPLAYGHSDEFSFLIRSTSTLLSRRVFKITSMIPVVFATRYNSRWDHYFGDPSRGDVTKREYDAWFDARPKEYANYRSVINYFRWRQIDCHINNLYNTTLHALTGRYVRHELVPVTEHDEAQEPLYEDGSGNGKMFRLKRTPISEWIQDSSRFLSARAATDKLCHTVSADKHDILFLDHKINYNNELEQFKKGTILVDTNKDYKDKETDESSIKRLHVDITKSSLLWDQYSHIFDDYVKCPTL